MDLRHPGSDLLGEDQAALLMVLARTTEPLSGRAIAQRAGRSDPTTSRRILQSLDRAGLVRSSRVGNAITYVLNRDHVLFSPVFEILASPAAVDTTITRVLDSHGVVAAASYGSYARREATPDSDIDLVVVVENGEDVAALHDSIVPRVEQVTGNAVQPVILELSMLQHLVDIDDALVSSWRADAHSLVGDFHALLAPNT